MNEIDVDRLESAMRTARASLLGYRPTTYRRQAEAIADAYAGRLTEPETCPDCGAEHTAEEAHAPRPVR